MNPAAPSSFWGEAKRGRSHGCGDDEDERGDGNGDGDGDEDGDGDRQVVLNVSVLTTHGSLPIGFISNWAEF